MTKYTEYAGRALLVWAMLLSLSVPFLSLPSTIFAQDDEPTTVVISGSTFLESYVSELVGAYQGANEDTTEFSFQPGGNDSGFAGLCDGSADVVMATRDISDEEIVNCDTAGVEFVEVLVGAEALVLVPTTGIASTTACVPTDTLPSYLGAAVVDPLTWAVVSPIADTSEITLYGPTNDNLSALLASLLPDGQVNSEYERFEDAAEFLPQLQELDANILAFMSLAEWDAIEDKGDLVAFQASDDAFVTCVAPTVDNVVAGDYPLGRRFLLYVNSASLAKNGVSPMLQFAVGADGAPVLASNSGFSAPSNDAIVRSLVNVVDVNTGRTFTRANTPFDMNTATAGDITITGTSRASIAAKVVNDNFSATFVNANVNVTAATEDAAWTAFCNGETNVIQVTGLRDCDNGTASYPISYGGDAVVLLVANEALPACVSYADINTLLVNSTVDPNKGVIAETDASVDSEADAEDADTSGDTPEQTDPAPQGPTSWSAIGVEGDLALLILSPQFAGVESDVILSITAADATTLPRNDAPTVQFDRDDVALSHLDYRVAGLAQFDGGALTYMKWSEWQGLENAPESVRPVAVGENCVVPSAETIQDGSYPFSLNSYLVFSENALKDSLAASYMWYAYDGAALDQLAEMNLAGFDRSALESERDSRFDLIAELHAIGVVEAEAAAAEEAEANAEGDADTSGEDTSDEADTEDTTEDTSDTSEEGDTTEDGADASAEDGDTPSEDDATEIFGG